MKKTVRTPDFPIVDTPKGKLHGFLSDDVYHFHGIRYAEAGRFEEPKPTAAWEGIRDAKAYGYICPLLPEEPHAEGDPNGAPENSFEMPHVYWPMSENCQFLNVWTKHINEDARRPVMVWFHGGGYCSGSSIEIPAYDGHNLASCGDVVVVNLNHRLNVVGYLDLSSFGEKYSASGILGMLDIIEALKWVHENIAAFGGDPENVTIAGQSGGGGKVAVLMQMPEADGLFQKAVIESGAIRGTDYPEAISEGRKSASAASAAAEDGILEKKAIWQKLGEQTANELGLDAGSIDRIREVSYDELSQAATRAAKSLHMMTGMMMLEPSPTEGRYFGDAGITGFRPETAGIPMLIGTTLGEFTFMHYLGNKDQYTEAEKMEILRRELGDKTEEILREFVKLYPDKDILYAMSVDTKFKRPALAYIKARAAFAKTPVFAYQMNLIIPYLGGVALWHCGEIPYVFRNVEMEPMQCMRDDAEDVMEVVSHAWLNFMETGNPDGEQLHWEPFTKETPCIAYLDGKSELTQEHSEKLLELLASVRPPFLA